MHYDQFIFTSNKLLTTIIVIYFRKAELSPTTTRSINKRWDDQSWSVHTRPK